MFNMLISALQFGVGDGSALRSKIAPVLSLVSHILEKKSQNQKRAEK